MALFPLPEAVSIQTGRLALREFSEQDVDAIQIYAGDAEVTRYTSFGPNSPEVTAAVLASWIEERERLPRVEWPLAIVNRDDGVLIGGTGLHEVNWESGEAMFGYVLRRSAWGKGYATEAGRAVVDWAFGPFGLRKLVAYCEEEHAASVAVLRKLGFSQEAAVALPRMNGEIRQYLTFVIERGRSPDRHD
jgi:ribosomal-protein-alanine N-acetyltransferase